MRPFYKFISIFLLFSYGLLIAQKNFTVPANSFFYMEINGKQLDKKVNWEKVNPFLNEIEKNSKKKLNWNDFTKTGINYNDTQYHYATQNDSITAYTAHLPIDNISKFLEFVSANKKPGQEITKKNNYSYIDLDNNTFVAWNQKQAVLKYINYQKPYKYSDVIVADSTSTDAYSSAVVVDSAAAVVEPTPPLKDQEETVIVQDEEIIPFDYKQEIKILKEDIKYLKENIKYTQKEIAEKQKSIKYLQKHHKYPEEKSTDEPPAEETTTEQYTENDEVYEKELDSITIENFKIVKTISENSFNEIFSSASFLQINPSFVSHRDPNADVYLYTNLQSLADKTLHNKYNKLGEFQSILYNAYNSDSFYNFYFEKDKVKLVHGFQQRDPRTHKNIIDIYNGKRNKKLAALIPENNIGSLSININSEKYFDLIYNYLGATNDQKYKKEIELFVESMKIALDEKAIAKIAPGNGVFILNDFKKKKVDYVDYEYDDDYVPKEIKKNKIVNVPDFTFAFATENEDYWIRVFEALVNSEKWGGLYEKIGSVYSLKNRKSKKFDSLYFTVKNNIVCLSTSLENLDYNRKQKSAIAKESSKYALYGKFDLQKLLLGLTEDLNNTNNKKTFDYLKNNVGDVLYKTNIKSDSVESEIIYQLRNSSSENSLMYFFDLFKELYKEETKKTDKV